MSKLEKSDATNAGSNVGAAPRRNGPRIEGFESKLAQAREKRALVLAARQANAQEDAQPDASDVWNPLNAKANAQDVAPESSWFRQAHAGLAGKAMLVFVGALGLGVGLSFGISAMNEPRDASAAALTANAPAPEVEPPDPAASTAASEVEQLATAAMIAVLEADQPVSEAAAVAPEVEPSDPAAATVAPEVDQPVAVALTVAPDDVLTDVPENALTVDPEKVAFLNKPAEQAPIAISTEMYTALQSPAAVAMGAPVLPDITNVAYLSSAFGVPALPERDEVRAALLSEDAEAAPIPVRARVYLLVPTGIPERRLNAYIAELEVSGFEVARVGRESYRVSTTHLRYYINEVASDAAMVAGELGIEARDFTSIGSSSERIEIYVQGNPLNVETEEQRPDTRVSGRFDRFGQER